MYEGCLRIHSLTQSVTSIAEPPATRKRNTMSRNIVDPIRLVCVAVMKLVRSVFAHTCTERTALARAIYVSR